MVPGLPLDFLSAQFVPIRVPAPCASWGSVSVCVGGAWIWRPPALSWESPPPHFLLKQGEDSRMKLAFQV